MSSAFTSWLRGAFDSLFVCDARKTVDCLAIFHCLFSFMFKSCLAVNALYLCLFSTVARSFVPSFDEQSVGKDARFSERSS